MKRVTILLGGLALVLSPLFVFVSTFKTSNDVTTANGFSTTNGNLIEHVSRQVVLDKSVRELELPKLNASRQDSLDPEAEPTAEVSSHLDQSDPVDAIEIQDDATADENDANKQVSNDIDTDTSDSDDESTENATKLEESTETTTDFQDEEESSAEVADRTDNTETDTDEDDLSNDEMSDDTEDNAQSEKIENLDGDNEFEGDQNDAYVKALDVTGNSGLLNVPENENGVKGENVFDENNAIIVLDNETQIATAPNTTAMEDNGVAQLSSADHSPVNTASRRRNRKQRSFWVWVVLASKYKAWLFKNNKHIGAVHNWKQVRTFKFRATRRDLIAIKSVGRGNYRGVIAIIRVDWPGKGRRVHTRHYVTGRSGNYKAIPTHRASRRDRRFWMRPQYKTCHWPRAVNMPRGRHVARGFPIRRFRASYIWARGARGGSQVLMRYKLTGERCRRTPPRSPKKCACKPVASQPNAACYQFTNQKMYKTINRNGRCKKRKCAPKYECVSRKQRSKIICVRRFAKTEVRIVGRVFRRVCRNIRIRPKPFYVPYQ